MLLDPDKFLAGDPLTAHLYMQAIRRWVRRFFHDPNLIDSVVQAASAEIIARLRAGERPAPERMLHWIYACTHNAVRRERTRVGKRTEPYESYLHGQAPEDMSQQLRLRDELERVEDVLDNADERACMILRDRIRGLSYREIARSHDMREGAARESVSRLRRRLLEELSARDKVERLVARARRLGLAPHPSLLSGEASEA